MKYMKHMRWWVWLLAVIELSSAFTFAVRGVHPFLEAFAAMCGGGTLGFALRDWGAGIDDECARLVKEKKT